jgi:hypothetical protein
LYKVAEFRSRDDVGKKENKILMNDLIDLMNQLVASYSLKNDVNRHFLTPALSNCKTECFLDQVNIVI